MQGGSSRNAEPVVKMLEPGSKGKEPQLDRFGHSYNHSMVEYLDEPGQHHYGTKGKGRQLDAPNRLYSRIVTRDNARVHMGDVYNYHSHHNVDHEQRRILDWLTALDPSSSHNQAWNQYQEGTLGWFFKETRFQAWRDDCDHRTPPTLWCRGDLGTGKTTLVAQILNHLQSSNMPNCSLAVVYCRAAEQNMQTPEMVLGSILVQLWQRDDQSFDIPNNVKEAFDNFSRKFQAWRRPKAPKMKELEHWLDERLSCGQPAYILLDALDEMNPQYRRQVLRALQSPYTALRLLATSRNIPEIGSELPEHQEIEITAHKRDLKTLIQARLHERGTETFHETILKQSSNSPFFATIEEEIFSKVIDSAKNMYVSTICTRISPLLSIKLIISGSYLHHSIWIVSWNALERRMSTII